MKDHQLENMNELLRLAAPGTSFRDGLENVLRAKTGALIVVGYSPEVMEVVEGGFSINCDFSPNYLYELAKMDGAIILSEDLKRILYANTQLIPDSSISSIGPESATGQLKGLQNRPGSWSSPFRSGAISSRSIRAPSAMRSKTSASF